MKIIVILSRFLYVLGTKKNMLSYAIHIMLALTTNIPFNICTP